MSKHTPGPWLIAEDFFISVRVGNNFPEVAQVFDAPFDDGQAHANAQLIAAAPDLLESLTNLLEFAAQIHAGKTVGICFAEMDKARAAIAKATGGES